MYYIFIFLFCIPYSNTKATGVIARFYTLDNGPKDIKTFEDEFVTFQSFLTFSVNHESLKNEDLILHCWMDYIKVGHLVNWKDLPLPRSWNVNSTTGFRVTIFAERLGASNFDCSMMTANASISLYNGRVAKLIVSRHQTIEELIFRVFITTCVIFLTFVMGCGLDLTIVINYFKKPISPFIGLCSQFIFMPLISALLGKITGIDDAFGLGLLVVGCSPGGGSSNLWTILFEGDLNLSMTMTFISSCAAFFMMPLWLFILGRLFIDPKNVRIPYDKIVYNLLLIVIPAGVGIAFRWKWEDKAKLLIRKVKLLGLLFLLLFLTFGPYANRYIFKLIRDYAYLMPIGAAFPWLGFIFGYVLALVSRRGKDQAIAIALETGIQNIGIAIIILKFSMPQPFGDLGSLMPIIVYLFTPIPLYLGYVILFITRMYFSIKEKERGFEILPNAVPPGVLPIELEEVQE